MRRTKLCHPPRIYLVNEKKLAHQASPARPPATPRPPAAGPSLERPPRHQPPLLLAPFLGGAASGSLPTVTPQRGLPPRHISPVPPIASQGGVPPRFPRPRATCSALPQRRPRPTHPPSAASSPRSTAELGSTSFSVKTIFLRTIWSGTLEISIEHCCRCQMHGLL